MSDRYSTPEFEAAYTYHGSDLGAHWHPQATTFRVWAPTAQSVSVKLYRSGNPEADDLIETIPMSEDCAGTWITEKTGDLNGVYYTYLVNVDGMIHEAVDPYARTTGVNGARGMILDLKSTDPEHWAQDHDPNPLSSITDAVICELHVRDLSMDPHSGIQNKGKFLGLIESGTKTPGGVATGLDHLKSLGITHLHILPMYDYGSVDEAHPEADQFNWGYDPVNFNVPEGSYSTDPFHGEVRVRELKQTIQGLHANGISVVMDVVYNHVYDAQQFCFNKIVPGYFSRITDGVYANGSGCGNDTASERSMVRKYIVDSLCYWVDEYHIDGFRFDLVGLLDVDTINEAMAEVHKNHPNVIFYGEGWDLPTQTVKPCRLAVQANSHLTPGFAYFSDTIRDTLRGSVFYLEIPGFATGGTGLRDELEHCFRGLPAWCNTPGQSINYVSCHDNNTLLDRIALALPDATQEELIRRSRLAAAFSMCAQGVPFFQAGEEMLRSKPDGHGGFVENSYRSPDCVNALKWDLLEQPHYRENVSYYTGLIALRKAHPIFRLSSAETVRNAVSTLCSAEQAIAFRLQSDTEHLLAAFNGSTEPWTLSLPAGTWQILVNADTAGTSAISCVQNTVTIPPLSPLILQEALYKKQGKS